MRPPPPWQLTDIIAAAASDILHFLVIFVVVYVAYAHAFFMAFGSDLPAFASLLDSLYSLFMVILGDFDFNEMKEANPIMTPVLFFSFIASCFFVLLNMFIAILTEAYEKAKVRRGKRSSNSPSDLI